ncbi:MAG: hypothetical protein OET44_10220 [Gammaproteobacteria bacterium]|nr:hypothetical protein [Gammaproteobacteria bacterium]
MRLSTLEKQVLSGIADAHAQGGIVLAQMARAEVDQREYSTHGFRTFFRIDAVGRHLDRALWKTEHMPTAHARHPALRGRASFTLVIADGFICCLEASSHRERWPTDEARFVIEK